MTILERADLLAHYLASNSTENYHKTYAEVKEEFLGATRKQQVLMYVSKKRLNELTDKNNEK